MSDALVMGAVAYDPKVVTIWDGFRGWLRQHGFAFDYVLYSHYERQAADLIAGRLDAAWNSPLAWVRSRRLAAAQGVTLRPVVMRDTDRDLTSVVVVNADSAIREVSDLHGRTVATGAVDSPQATLIPLSQLAKLGIEVTVRRFDKGVGLHGDHVGGERHAARALVDGEVDAAVMLDANHLVFRTEGVLPAERTRIVYQTPPFDHCNLTVTDAAPADLVAELEKLLLSMSYTDPRVRRLLDLEGLTSWEEGRDTGYAALEEAVERFGFYGPRGEVLAAEYQP